MGKKRRVYLDTLFSEYCIYDGLEWIDVTTIIEAMEKLTKTVRESKIKKEG